jgi:hypothetical protein
MKIEELLPNIVDEYKKSTMRSESSFIALNIINRKFESTMFNLYDITKINGRYKIRWEVIFG